MTPRRKSTDRILEELSENPEPQRPLRGHEIIRMAPRGSVEPGDYRYENHYLDGRVKVETFRVDESGLIRDLKTWIETPDSVPPETGKRTAKSRRPPSAR